MRSECPFLRQPAAWLPRAICFVTRFHERALTESYIEHEPIEIFRQFLTHDAGDDEGPRRHGAGDVTQRIKFFVCQTNLGCLSNHKNADALELFDRARSIQVHIEARNAFEFIKRAASNIQTASGNHWHPKVITGQQRCQNE